MFYDNAETKSRSFPPEGLATTAPERNLGQTHDRSKPAMSLDPQAAYLVDDRAEQLRP